MGNCIRRQPACRVHKTLRNKILRDDYRSLQPVPTRTPMTYQELKRLREVFWYIMTNDEVEGKVWKILEEIVKLIQENEFDKAQKIINSSDLYLPYGELANVLDHGGNMYYVPSCMICFPDNMIIGVEEDEEEEEEEEKTTNESKNSDETAEVKIETAEVKIETAEVKIETAEVKLEKAEAKIETAEGKI